MAYADYSFYKTEYAGSMVPEADFPRLASRSSEYIDSVTFDRLVNDETLISDKVKKACCALAELTYSYEQSSQEGDMQKVSEKVGEYSVQYAAATDKSGHVLNINEKKHTLAKQYLAHTGLMYRGW
ncbi:MULTISPECIES: hypothetical protein [Cellulosilyticum]|uniref:Uncharacterized protein n=1 Tax=Cellulosilyticum lentocellum (strain ATCC 49066 / DSM 5427 / NCIMB 11756 / RHM5) TaxID=642492 RepID=F2JQ07_CELLD|nr:MULTISPECIES: hypothetical protein [Cellulosilyticum]ADZ82555.1 hypothetical protein Clole_0822 [Cellulosilyticum lentocellum DSM 5427]QEH69723.1 hypothetical protein EKH84_15510 [Cellulosilyticum sp. WCF-2]